MTQLNCWIQFTTLPGVVLALFIQPVNFKHAGDQCALINSAREGQLTQSNALSQISPALHFKSCGISAAATKQSADFGVFEPFAPQHSGGAERNYGRTLIRSNWLGVDKQLTLHTDGARSAKRGSYCSLAPLSSPGQPTFRIECSEIYNWGIFQEAARIHHSGDNSSEAYIRVLIILERANFFLFASGNK